MRSRRAGLGVVVAVAALAMPGAMADPPGGPVAGSLQQAYRPLRITSAAQLASEPANVEVALPAGVEPLTVQATLVSPPRRAWEPTVGITAEGVAFTFADDNDLSEGGEDTELGTEVLRSDDGGITWESVHPRLPALGRREGVPSLDPYVYVDDTTGRVFHLDLYAACAYLLYSDDLGETWERNPAACGELANDHQTVIAGPPPPALASLMVGDYPNVVYYCSSRIADAACGRSLDGGATFSPSLTPSYPAFDSFNGGFCTGGMHGHAATDADGRLFIPKGHCTKPWLSVSRDGGDTWQRSQVDDLTDAAIAHTSVAADAAGTLYYTWYDTSHHLPFLAVSRDHGLTWDDPLMIAPPGVVEVNFPTIEAGDEGKIAITFPGSTDAAGEAWNQYAIVSTNALDDSPLFLSATGNDPHDPVLRGACGGETRCDGIGDFIDVEITPSGELWAAATDGCVDACSTGSGPILERGYGLMLRQVGGPSLRTSG